MAITGKVLESDTLHFAWNLIINVGIYRNYTTTIAYFTAVRNMTTKR